MKILLLSSILLVFLARLHLGLVRYFDPDEFAYLHWSYLLSIGQLPYRDFFFIIAPSYQVFLLPAILIRQWAQAPIAARLLQYVLYLATTYLLYRMSISLFHKKTTALLSVLLFITFPMTMDKTIDLRPDMLMMAMLFLAMLSSRSLLTGLFMGLSLLIHPKIMFALPMFVYLQATSSKKPRIVPLVVGLLLPFFLFFLYLVFYRILPTALISLTGDSLLANVGKVHFSPFSALAPFPLVYVSRGGISLPWMVNTALWTASLVGLILLVFQNRRIGIAFTLYFVFGIGLLFVFPVPFLQYFLPLTAVASVLAGYSLRKNITVVNIIIVITVLSSFFLQYRERVAPGAENSEQIQVIRDVLTVSKPDETFYDMVGSFVFRPDGYFICCHPYGEFASKLKHPPASLSQSLIANKTKFLVLDRVGFVFWQTPEPDLTFLLTHYLPTKYKKIYSLGQLFRCQTGACVQYNLHYKAASNKSTAIVSVPVAEMYSVAIEPSDETITLNNAMVKNGDSIPLNEGVYPFSVSPRVSSFRIQLTR